jgi:hypothetical protein
VLPVDPVLKLVVKFIDNGGQKPVPPAKSTSIFIPPIDGKSSSVTGGE